MSFFGSSDFLLQVAQGNVAGHAIYLLRGHNPDVDAASGQECLWTQGGSLTYLSSAETMEIASTSTSDTSAGTGVRTVLIEGVDGTGAAISEIVTMNGTTNVTTSNSYYRVNQMVSLTVGTGELNAGEITATATTAGTVQCVITTGEGISRLGHYTVPLNKSACIYRVEFNTSKVSGGAKPVVELRGFARQNGGPWLQLFDKILDAEVADEANIDVPLPSAMAARVDLRLTADTDTNNTDVRARMYLLVIDD